MPTQPPATGPADPVNKRLIKTPAGHEVLLDDLEQSDHGRDLDRAEARRSRRRGSTLETAGGTAKVSLETSGRIELKADLEIVLDATSVSIKGTSLDLKADASAQRERRRCAAPSRAGW